MINYAYIDDLFKSILSNSKAIQGRFYIGHKYGLQEINYDNLGEILTAIPATKKYPLAMMAPPHSTMRFSGKTTGWETYRIVMFFVKNSYTEDISLDTKTSQHRIMHDWHDMKRVAVNFMRALVNVQRNTMPTQFRVLDHLALFIPFSGIGADRVSGIQLNFDFELFIDCVEEDYVTLPTAGPIISDSHPEHQL